MVLKSTRMNRNGFMRQMMSRKEKSKTVSRRKQKQLDRKNKSIFSNIGDDIMNMINSVWNSIKRVMSTAFGLSKQGLAKIIALGKKGLNSVLTSEVSRMLTKSIGFLMKTSGYEYMLPTTNSKGKEPLHPPPFYLHMMDTNRFYNWLGGNVDVDGRISGGFTPIDRLDSKAKMYAKIYDKTQDAIDINKNVVKPYIQRLVADKAFLSFSKSHFTTYVGFSALTGSGSESLIFKLLAILSVMFVMEIRIKINETEIDKLQKTMKDDEEAEDAEITRKATEEVEKEERERQLKVADTTLKT